MRTSMLRARLQGAVTAWVHERCIAQGRLVVIGDRLGVRLDEVFAPISRPSKTSI
jgi:flagellar motor switch/type III secretory pathway protein FliN